MILFHNLSLIKQCFRIYALSADNFTSLSQFHTTFLIAGMQKHFWFGGINHALGFKPNASVVEENERSESYLGLLHDDINLLKQLGTIIKR